MMQLYSTPSQLITPLDAEHSISPAHAIVVLEEEQYQMAVQREA